MTLQPREKTMTDDEIEALAKKIVAEVEQAHRRSAADVAFAVAGAALSCTAQALSLPLDQAISCLRRSVRSSPPAEQLRHR